MDRPDTANNVIVSLDESAVFTLGDNAAKTILDCIMQANKQTAKSPEFFEALVEALKDEIPDIFKQLAKDANQARPTVYHTLSCDDKDLMQFSFKPNQGPEPTEQEKLALARLNKSTEVVFTALEKADEYTLPNGRLSENELKAAKKEVRKCVQGIYETQL